MNQDQFTPISVEEPQEPMSASAKQPATLMNGKIKVTPAFIKSAALVLISFVLFILAFCPIVSYQSVDLLSIGFEDTYSAGVGVGAPGAVGIFFESLQSKSSSDLADDLEDRLEDLEDDYNDLYEEYANDDFEEFGDEYTAIKHNVINTFFHESLKHKDVSVDIFSILSLILSIALIGVTGLCLVFSAWNLFCLVTDKENPKATMMSAWIQRFLILIPTLILTLFFLIVVGKNINNVSAEFGVCYLVSIAGSAVVAIVLSILAIGGLVAFKVINKELTIDKKWIIRAVSAAAAFIIVCLGNASLFSVSATIDEDHSLNVSMNPYLFGLCASSADFHAADDLISDSAFLSMLPGRNVQNFADSLSYQDTDNITDKELSAVLPVSIAMSLSSESRLDDSAAVATSFLLFFVFFFLIFVFFSAAVFYFDVNRMLEPQKAKGRGVGFRVTTLVLSAILLLISLIFASAMQFGIGSAGSSTVGLGIVVIFVLSIVSIIFRPKKDKQKKDAVPPVDQTPAPTESAQ